MIDQGLWYAMPELVGSRVRLEPLRVEHAEGYLRAAREGVLRKHRRRADGSWRDTVVYSIVDDDWPGVRDGLRGRLARAVSGGQVGRTGPGPDSAAGAGVK
ncbi:hypothetical protein ACQEVZ_42970 [Dactylosporangium sp. CA-152071]|uniref:hypothetical protein n=1 Tax=Dactylosporangium sp. CA-152071 TaxID=3239933 RepID=UPI003D925A2A